MTDLIAHLEASGLHPVVVDEETNFNIPSPFLPGTNIQYAWDSTSIGYLKRCPRLYQYQMIDGYQPKGEIIHLRFGIEYHQALHDYENCLAEGQSHEEALFHTIKASLQRTWLWKEVEPRTDTEKLKTRYNLIRTVIWYLDKFEKDPAQTILLQNGKPACEVSFRFELDWGPNVETDQPYLLSGHLDRVVEFQGQIFNMDRKTASKTLGSYYFDQYEPDNQMTLYTLAAKVIFEAPVKGVIIDAAQIAVGFSRFVRGITYRTDDQLDEWIKDLEYWFAQAETYANANYWPMNDTACDKFGGCRFRKVCSKSPSVRESFLKSDFVKGEIWNPLKVR